MPVPRNVRDKNQSHNIVFPLHRIKFAWFQNHHSYETRSRGEICRLGVTGKRTAFWGQES